MYKHTVQQYNNSSQPVCR